MGLLQCRKHCVQGCGGDPDASSGVGGIGQTTFPCCPTSYSTLIQQMPIEYALCARYGAGHWGYINEQNLCPPVADILVGKTPDSQINRSKNKPGREGVNWWLSGEKHSRWRQQ